MAEVNCTACAELRDEVPELIANGFDDAMCASLQRDTGLKASFGNDDCTDLNNLNDCLIGNLETEVELYETCDWKEFTKDFINNLWTVLKAIICSICGLFTAIKSFRLSKDGNTITLTSIFGNHGSATVTGTTYTMSINGHKITLRGSDNSSQSVTVPDADTRYQIHTTTYTKNAITVAAGDTAVIDISISQPSQYSDTLYPMAIAGWMWEGEFASYLITRYIQLVDRSGSPKVRCAVRNIATAVGDGSHDAHVSLNAEVLWWGRRTD